MPYDLLQEGIPATAAVGERPSRSASYHVRSHAKAPSVVEGTTLFEVFEQSVKNHAQRPSLGYRPIGKDGKAGAFTFMTYQEMAVKVKAFSASLKAAQIEKGSRVAVFGANSCEWMIAMQVRLSLILNIDIYMFQGFDLLAIVTSRLSTSSMCTSVPLVLSSRELWRFRRTQMHCTVIVMRNIFCILHTSAWAEHVCLRVWPCIHPQPARHCAGMGSPCLLDCITRAPVPSQAFNHHLA
jgi:hypothetical protein